ncbi:hypothetical protein DMENIID0001_041760 [Sergentomyia squamirostris]
MDFIMLGCPLVSKASQQILQAVLIFLVSQIFIYILAVLLILGFYIVTILNIFSDGIAVLDQEIRNAIDQKYLRNLHLLHLEIQINLREFETLFYRIQIVQIVTSLPLIVGGQLLILLYPTSLISYLMYMVFIRQFFVNSIFGECIHSKTAGIFTALYLTRWYEMSLSDQMILLMMMKNTIKPFAIKAAGMYSINMAAFLEVVKMSFSFCAILHALN